MASLHQLIGSSALSTFRPLRELDDQLVSLKAANDDLELRNDMLSQSNAELKAQISTISIPPEEVPLGSNNSTSSNGNGGEGGGGGGGGSALSLSVNVVTNIPATTSAVSTGTSTVGVASATVPIHFESQYRRSMESGLQ